MKRIFKTLALSLLLPLTASAQEAQYNTPGAGNPFIPGYFADPTVKKFGDTYYIYATTDGSGAGFGPAQCWTSKDFRNWTLVPMNWPTSHWIWAPDVMHYTDGKYYMVYCQPCNLYIGQADSPTGPWHNYLAKNLTPDGNAVKSPEFAHAAMGPQAQALGKEFDNEGQPIWVYDRYVTGAITLDGQTFVDDDGSVYVYWGTWGIYKGFGCGVGKASKDLKTFTETRLIPNTEATDFFEAPFVMKRNGIYYFMYSSESCHNETYHVQYATATNPMGPYTYKGTILKTSADGTIHGPGHHSVLEQVNDKGEKEYYIVYHRHDNPHSTRGFHRQLCVDKLEFDAEGNILPVKASHEGSFPKLPSSVKSNNIAYQAKVTASSYYDENFKPEYAVDDNNGTLWRPKTMGEEWLQIDLGKAQKVQTVWTQWEYGTQYYQYKIETSLDGKTWTLFADRERNRRAGSPKVDTLAVPIKARYVKVTFYGCQKVGYPGALWNVKVFPQAETSCGYEWPETLDQGKDGKPIIDITADDFQKGDTVNYIENHGSLGGGYDKQIEPYRGWNEEMHMPLMARNFNQEIVVENVEGKLAIPFDSASIWKSDFVMPALWKDNVPYHLEAELYNPTMQLNECVADFTTTHDELEKVMLVNGTEPRCGVLNHYAWFEDVGTPRMKEDFEGKWQHVVVDFDGRTEKVWINDQLISSKDIQIMVKPTQNVLLGRNAEHEWPFTGYLHSLKLIMK